MIAGECSERHPMPLRTQEKLKLSGSVSVCRRPSPKKSTQQNESHRHSCSRVHTRTRSSSLHYTSTHTHTHTRQQHTQLVSFVRSLSLAWYFTSLLPWTGSENERKKDRSTVVYGSGDGGSNIFHQLHYSRHQNKQNRTNEQRRRCLETSNRMPVYWFVSLCVCVSAA